MGADSTRAPVGATTLTTQDDAAIFAAWDRRAAAFATLQELPNNVRGDGETPERHAQWAIVDDAETEIHAAVAATPRGLELQLWTALHNHYQDAEAAEAASRGDLDWFNANDSELDWPDKLFVAAMRSVRAMHDAAEKGGAA